MQTLFLFMPGSWEVVLIIFAILLLFGGKKIPELMRGIGKGIREFNAAKETVKTEIEKGIKEEDNPPAREPKRELEQPSE